MKLFLKRLIAQISKFVFSELNLRRIKASRPFSDLIHRNSDRIKALQCEYAFLHRDQTARSLFKHHERKMFSQNGEDGLLLHLFSLVGAPNKNFIEFGVEDGVECQAANLAINFGWCGLLIEGSPKQAAMAREFYHVRQRIGPNDVKIECRFLTVENVNETFKSNGFSGEIDLLSVDIDGVDYWIWKAINVVNPRIVVVEYNASFGVERSVTVPYSPSFNRYAKHVSGWYHGASLAALTHLAEEKGYVLAGCDSLGSNAFCFVSRTDGRNVALVVGQGCDRGPFPSL